MLVPTLGVFIPDETQSVELALLADADCLLLPTDALVGDPRTESELVIGPKVLRDVWVTMLFDVLEETEAASLPRLIDRPFLDNSTHFAPIINQLVGGQTVSSSSISSKSKSTSPSLGSPSRSCSTSLSAFEIIRRRRSMLSFVPSTVWGISPKFI